MGRLTLTLALILLLIPVAQAATFTEDFESFQTAGVDPQLKPDQDWYNYREGSDVGNVSTDPPVPEGAQAFKFTASDGGDITEKKALFKLAQPAQLTATSFQIAASTIADNGEGSMQKISISSNAPVRTVAQFFVFCVDATNTTGCELRVRWDHVDTIGQVLINTSQGQSAWLIEMTFDWVDSEFCLMVDGFDDGCFPFLELPQNIERLTFTQYRQDVPWALTFDNWTVEGASDEVDELDADAADGLKNFADAIRFTSDGSLFMLGLVFFIIMSAAVIVPVLTVARNNTILPGLAFYEMLLVLWLIYMEWWPDWIGIAMIIVVAAVISATLRQFLIGIKNATTPPTLVVTALGYFIIASSFLGFSGYASESIDIPTGPAEQQDINQTSDPDQTFIGAVTECIVTGGVFTFGLKGDCSQKTVSKTWTQITDVFGWVRSGLDFLFQLLTFSLPIPVIFNIMIVAPPAVGLFVAAVQIIRGNSN